jgi:molybdopterin-guanine dinucleotide biosynthesis protein A
MFSAILMAGYNNKREVKRYSKIVAEHYGEKFIETGYRPLRKFEVVIKGKKVSKPLIQITLEKLFEIDLIDDIIIVGHQMLIEQHLSKFINQFKKPCQIVNQNSKIPSDLIQCFNIRPRKVKFNSIAGNLIKGYAASAACKDKKHALVVASDSPLTTKEFIEYFLNHVQKCEDPASIISPVILINDPTDKLGRKPLKLINDSEYQLSGIKDRHNRQGFRLSPLMFLNPYLFDFNTVNTAYSLRKWMNPNVQMRLFKITRSYGYPNVYSKYFLKKNLSIKEIENIGSAFFKGRLKLIPTLGEESTYDYDGTESEYQSITHMLKSSFHP